MPTENITAIIVDDEINAIKMLAIELEQQFPNIDIVGQFQDPKEAIDQIETLEPSILFVDIEMPYMSGFDLVKKLKHKKLQVIFITAYSQYGIEAIKANALDYLLKPLDSVELRDAVNKALVRIKESHENMLELILERVAQFDKDSIKIPTSNGFAFVKKEEIIYCQSESNYTHIFTISKNFLVSKTLKYIQELLPEKDFLRIHHSYLVNLAHIKEYSRKDGGFVVLSDNKTLRVSNSRKDIFNEI